ncbi:hypothetical protein Efla_002515 [Eimeria flavescens]
MSVSVVRVAHPRRSIIMELNGAMHTPASGIGGSCFAGDEGTPVGGLLETFDRLQNRGLRPTPHRSSIDGPSFSLTPRPSPQQQVWETLPNRLIGARLLRDTNDDGGLLEPSARRHRTQALPESATDMFPAFPDDRESEKSEAEERSVRRFVEVTPLVPSLLTPHPLGLSALQASRARLAQPKCPDCGVPLLLACRRTRPLLLLACRLFRSPIKKPLLLLLLLEGMWGWSLALSLPLFPLS